MPQSNDDAPIEVADPGRPAKTVKDVRAKIIRLLLRHESVFTDPTFNGAIHLNFSVKDNAVKAVLDLTPQM